MWRFFVIICFFICGCTIPAMVLFRNFSSDKVRLQASLVNRRFFKKLPNKVNIYDTALKKNQFYGEWRTNAFVTWKDSVRFYLDVPPFTVIDIADISNGLTLGGSSPDVLLIMTTAHTLDTLFTGDYFSIIKNFKERPYGLFKPPVYYYDFH